MCRGPLFGQIVLFSVPLMLSGLLQLLFNAADLIVIETMTDLQEARAALLAAKENCDLPVFVSNAYGEDGKLMTGRDVAIAAMQ